MFRTNGSRRSFESEYRHSNGYEFLSKFQLNESKNNSNKNNNNNDLDSNENIEKSNGNIGYYDDDYNMKNNDGRKTLWYRMQEKNANNSIKNVQDPTISWKDLKLFLSYPCSERNSDSNSSSAKSIIYPTKYNDSDNDYNYGNIGSIKVDNIIFKNSNGNNNTKMKKKLMNINLLPDAIRIGIDIQNDLNNFEIKNQEDNNKHQSLISHFLKNENNHNIDNNKSYRIDNGFNSNFNMMRPLMTGTGTRTILSFESEFRDKNGHENEIFRDTNKTNLTNLNFETIESKNKKNSHSQKNLSEKTKKQQKLKITNICKKMLPLIRGMKTCDAKKRFDLEYLLPEMND